MQEYTVENGTLFDPDNDAYAYSLGYLALPGVLIAVLSLLIPVVFALVRLMCCSWRSRGGCCPTDRKGRGTCVPSTATLVFALLIAAGAAIVYVYGTSARHSVEKFVDVFVANLNSLVDDITEISSTLTTAAAELDTNVDDTVADLASDSQSIQNDVNDMTDKLSEIFGESSISLCTCVILFMLTHDEYHSRRQC